MITTVKGTRSRYQIEIPHKAPGLNGIFSLHTYKEPINEMKLTEVLMWKPKTQEWVREMDYFGLRSTIYRRLLHKGLTYQYPRSFPAKPICRCSAFPFPHKKAKGICAEKEE